MLHQVSAVLLAAGSAKRMGRLKQLLPLGKYTVVGHCIHTLLSAGIPDTTVVVGQDSGPVLDVLKDMPVKVAINELPQSGMSDSIRTGLRSADAGATGILVCLADHPLVRPDTVRELVVAHLRYPENVIIPSCMRRRGHPTLFPAEIVRNMPQESTMRDVISSHEKLIRYVETDDQGVLLDMDTPEDYEQILALLRNTPSPEFLQ